MLDDTEHDRAACTVRSAIHPAKQIAAGDRGESQQQEAYAT